MIRVTPQGLGVDHSVLKALCSSSAPLHLPNQSPGLKGSELFSSLLHICFVVWFLSGASDKLKMNLGILATRQEINPHSSKKQVLFCVGESARDLGRDCVDCVVCPAAFGLS